MNTRPHSLEPGHATIPMCQHDVDISGKVNPIKQWYSSRLNRLIDLISGEGKKKSEIHKQDNDPVKEEDEAHQQDSDSAKKEGEIYRQEDIPTKEESGTHKQDDDPCKKKGGDPNKSKDGKTKKTKEGKAVNPSPLNREVTWTCIIQAPPPV